MPCPRCYHRLDPVAGAIHPACGDGPDAISLRRLTELDKLAGPRKGDDEAHSCPGCGAATQPYAGGRRALCLKCTEDELGETVADIRARVNRERPIARGWRMTS